MSDQQRTAKPATVTRDLTPWALLGFALIGVLIGSGMSIVAKVTDPWNVGIIAVTVAVVVLAAWAVLNRRR